MLRIVAVLLVAIGALGLGWEGFTYATAERSDGSGEVTERRHTLWVPPVVSGIAVVSGLILLASNGRRDEV